MLKIGILFGGNSYEHEISIVSAISLKNKLQFELMFIFIDRDRDMFLINGDDLKSSLFDTLEYKKYPLISFAKKGFNKKSFFSSGFIECPNIINLVHGQDGEDGSIASFLSWYEFSYISPSLEASVLSYNKIYTKLYSKENNINTLEYEVLQDKKNPKTKFDFPVIIKPARLGSSLGINVAKNEEEFSYYVDEALEYDEDILIEPFIKGIKEFNLAGYFSDDLHFSKIEEVSKKEILDFDSKYLDFARDGIITDANISDELKQKMYDSFRKVYSNVFKNSIIRCDFFVYEDEIYLNEINSVPGSLANYLFDDYNQVIKGLFENFKTKKKINITYDYIKKIKKSK